MTCVVIYASSICTLLAACQFAITIGSKKKPLPVPTRFQPPRTVKRYTATGMEEIEELRRQNAEQAVIIDTMNTRMETLQAQLQALIEERRNDQDALHEARNREQEIENARQLAEVERVAAENGRRRLLEELEQNNIENENVRRAHIAVVHNQVNEAHDRDGLVLEYRNDNHGLRLGGKGDGAAVHEASHAQRVPQYLPALSNGNVPTPNVSDMQRFEDRLERRLAANITMDSLPKFSTGNVTQTVKK
uniref:Uncharacterized protein n=1 Tax=Trichogramma kaykai TaxID=54128 RepID=A0ABD2W9M1_9HYME